MRRLGVGGSLVVAASLGLAARTARAQAFLADDIVIISKGQRAKEQQRTETRLGPALGAPVGSPFRYSPGSPGASGPPTTPAPTGVLSAAAGLPDGSSAHTAAAAIVPPALLPSQPKPRYGPMEVPDLLDEGPPGGLTLDHAIDRLVHASPGLRARFQEIPQAQADILSAGLRANPLLFFSADSVPYGNYTPQRQGSTGYGVTWVQPLDVNGKRRARLAVAHQAKRVLEAQYQDAVRLEIDNLYTAFGDVLSARETVRSIRASLGVLDRVARSAEEQFRRGEVPQSQVDDAAVQRDSAELALGQAEAAYRQAKQALATVLATPPGEADGLEVRGALRDAGPPSPPVEDLVPLALCARPDLVAYRLGVGRAQADVRLARANRFEDVFLLYTPYGFQSNNFDPNIKGATSWGLGVLVALPLVNRNQGNIARAEGNVVQTQIELTGQERQVIGEVQRAATDYSASLAAVERFETSILPRAKRSRDDKYRLFMQGQEPVVTYLNAQRNYQDVVRQYLDTLVLHRRSMLRLNTAVGQRILP